VSYSKEHMAGAVLCAAGMLKGECSDDLQAELKAAAEALAHQQKRDAWSPVSKTGLLRGIREGKPTAEDLAIAEADGDSIRYYCEVKP
jgi:hypothetical protein